MGSILSSSNCVDSATWRAAILCSTGAWLNRRSATPGWLPNWSRSSPTSCSQQVAALKRATASIPIVFVNTGDPVGLHLVDSLARPGGNITGIANYVPELAGKRLEMIGEVVPSARRIAMLFNPLNPLSVETIRETETAASARTIVLVQAPVRSAEELPSALQRILDENAAALVGAADIMISSHTSSIIAFAARNRLPT